MLALDYGMKRIGVAISDEMGWTAQNLKFIERKSDKIAIDEIISVIAEFGNVEEIIIGLPLNMDGSEGEMVEKVRRFKEKLSKATQLPLIECDERLTSQEAEEFLVSVNVSRKKRKTKVDQMAAAFMLQKYLESKAK